MSTEAPLTEPTVALDVFVSGVAPIENVGENIFHLTFFVNQRCIQNGEAERVVVQLSANRDGTCVAGNELIWSDFARVLDEVR